MRPNLKITSRGCTVYVKGYLILIDQPYDDCVKFAAGYEQGIRKRIMSQLGIRYNTEWVTSQDGVGIALEQKLELRRVLNNVQILIDGILFGTKVVDYKEPLLQVGETITQYVLHGR
jgi:hypothetical protein